ncbi:hypothetical protein MSG28_014755 [Choristoneura fumiferana]|uniref:Uncharacterized protein n=1 Tax=Choristoneura fumiferana TaxID=7141 RepID=A0ACC0JSW7_CHOFU|nr:hypothetical protein MSG28_014755 [Choristoneura fumiferana]
MDAQKNQKKRPLLRATVNERTSCYVCLYRGMRRLPEAGRCWRRAAAAALAARWQTQGPGGLARLLAGPASASHHLEWLTNVLQSETPLADLVQLYTELLQSLDPTPSKVVSASLKLCSDPEEGINMLADVRADCDKFVAGIRQVLDDHDTGKNREMWYKSWCCAGQSTVSIRELSGPNGHLLSVPISKAYREANQRANQ